MLRKEIFAGEKRRKKSYKKNHYFLNFKKEKIIIFLIKERKITKF